MKTGWLKNMAIVVAAATTLGAHCAFAEQPSGTMEPRSDVKSVAAALGTKAGNHRPLANVKFAGDRLLVKFKTGGARPPSSAFPGKTSSPTEAAQQMSAALPMAAQTALANIHGRAVKGFANIGVLVVETPVGVGRAIEALYRSGTVEYAEPDYQVKALGFPNDPYFPDLWGQHNTGQTGGTPDADMDLPEAWDVRTAADTVIVGVVDTGIDYTHEDLSANMWQNPGEIPGNGIDDDANGYVDDVYGIDTWNYDSDPYDDNAHGTHVAGTIGAKGNNGVGVTGAAWNAKLMALKFLSADGYGYDSDAITLINYAINIKTANSYSRMILSNSWGGGGYSQALYDAIAAAANAGILFIAAAGNEGMDTDAFTNYPSGYALDNIIAVGASDHNDSPASFSNRGCSSVDLFAPGESILSTVPYNGYASYSGTSMATPQVSGLAALVWAQYPSLPWARVKNAMLNGVDGKPSLGQLAVTQGRANASNSLVRAMQTLPTVWEVNPSTAAPGSIVTIIGRNFGTTAGTVEFNGSALTVVSWDANVLKVQVPTDIPMGDPSGSGLAFCLSDQSAKRERGQVLPFAFLISQRQNARPDIHIAASSLRRYR